MSEDDGRHTREERSADSQGSRGGAAQEASAASVGEFKALVCVCVCVLLRLRGMLLFPTYPGTDVLCYTMM